jgi:hypothetical protein
LVIFRLQTKLVSCIAAAEQAFHVAQTWRRRLKPRLYWVFLPSANVNLSLAAWLSGRLDR